MTDTTPWTPGPWKLIWHGNEGYPFPLSVHKSDDTMWIARSGTVSSRANARLIAASPTLAEAAAKVITAVDDIYDVDDGIPDIDGDIMQAVGELRAALAKARGEG